ncbi:hypothetical protein Pst134EA_011434 [Puccinia striiformis f. sp. tritici]|uniref:hypothetical protein n=1 Tax=Puccinia striiformis f. sp. tritici TaxID=168172 RepID=UPI002007BB4E|nr:hypothetical protein Pst134EA_011434 [Puccinia striiformis f. sp. tritici]KAH9467811.1 hypothetical protein Pst134EA_011434 [Puccinia striiformis f. sp. tritici]
MGAGTDYPSPRKLIIDAHLSYGKALLRNTINLGSLSGGLNAHNPTANEPEDTTPKVNGNAPSSSKGPAKASTSEPDASKGIKGNPQIHFSGDDSDDDKEAGEEEDEEIDQAEEPVTIVVELENTFQVLDFAHQSIRPKSPLSKINQNPSKKLQTKLIDVHDLIAQVHQEGGQFEQAVESYKSSLEVKKFWADGPAGTI